MKKIAIIGGGTSGISLAQMLKTEADVTVFEQKQEIGGLIHCNREQDILYHRVGGHVFNSKNEHVTQWFWNFFDKDTEFIKIKRSAKVWFNNGLVGYPIEDHLFQLPAEITTNVVNDLLQIKQGESQDFETFLQSNFGQTLYEIYFRPYNKKIWNVDLSEVPLEWLEGKLPMPKLQDIFLHNILRREESNMVHSFFYYPKRGGSQFIIDRLSQGVSIISNCLINKIRKEGERLFINEHGPFERVVFTGDIRKLSSYLDNESFEIPQKEKVSQLKSNGTTNILCRCDNNDLSWLYIPEEQYKAHRIIYTGNFSQANNDNSGRSSCTVEFSNYISAAEAKQELKKLPGNLEFVAYNHEPNSYVIQNKDTRELIKGAKAALGNHNIYLLGRFAEWEYYNMDKCIESAMLLNEEINKN